MSCEVGKPDDTSNCSFTAVRNASPAVMAPLTSCMRRVVGRYFGGPGGCVALEANAPHPGPCPATPPTSQDRFCSRSSSLVHHPPLYQDMYRDSVGPTTPSSRQPRFFFNRLSLCRIDLDPATRSE